MKSSKITIEVQLDEQSVPEHITWTADDQPDITEKESKAMMLAMFDKESKDTLRVDLWTKELQIDEMDRFFYYSLRSMCDTYIKATNNQKLASEMRQFVQYFGEEVSVLNKDDDLSKGDTT